MNAATVKILVHPTERDLDVYEKLYVNVLDDDNGFYYANYTIKISRGNNIFGHK